MRHCCGSILLTQPEGPHGSPEDIIVEGVDDGAVVTGRWANQYSRAVRGLSSSRDIIQALNQQFAETNLEPFAKIAGEDQVRGALLGAADSHYEQETGEVVEFQLVDFGGSLMAAIRYIANLGILSDRSTDSMRKKAQRQGFSIAGLTNKRMLETTKRELVRQVSQGSDLRRFHIFVKQRLESAGFTPANPSHVETIFRTNVMTSYNSGRLEQQTQAKVLAARPYWQVITVTDGRQRPNHGALHRKVFRADDPAWQKAYPPFGFNCRCRVRSLPRTYKGKIWPGSFLTSHVPDKGFSSGIRIPRRVQRAA